MFKSKSIIKAKGLNQEKLINKLTDRCTNFEVFREQTNILKISVDFKKEKKFISQLKNNNFEIINIKRIGFFYHIEQLKKRIGLIVGSIVFVALLILQCFYLQDIKIEGNARVKESQIIEFLSSTDVKKYSKLNNIDCDKLENLLLEQFNEFSLVSVIKKGTTIIIKVKEKVLNEEVENLGFFEPLVAEYDCKITDIQLVQGTLSVKVGQTVKKGTVLVQPYVIDSEGKQRSVKPKAKINANIWYKTVLQHAETQNILKKTGNSEKVLQIKIGDLYLTKASPPNYEIFTTNITEILISKNNLLPLKRIITVYEEAKKETIFIDFNSVKKDLIEQCEQNTLQKLKQYEIINNKYINVYNCAGIYFVECTIEVNGEIAS